MQITPAPRVPEPKTSQLSGIADSFCQRVRGVADEVRDHRSSRGPTERRAVGPSLALGGQRSDGHHGNDSGCCTALHQSYPNVVARSWRVRTPPLVIDHVVGQVDPKPRKVSV